MNCVKLEWNMHVMMTNKRISIPTRKPTIPVYVVMPTRLDSMVITDNIYFLSVKQW